MFATLVVLILMVLMLYHVGTSDRSNGNETAIWLIIVFLFNFAGYLAFLLVTEIRKGRIGK